MNEDKVDKKDKALLNALQANGKLTNHQLADMVSLSPSATARRVQQLEQAGAITRYRAVLNNQFFGKTMHVFVFITLESQDHQRLTDFEEGVKQLPEIQDCFLLAGESDYLVRVVCADLQEFERIHSRELTKLPHVRSIKTTFGLRQVIQNRGIFIQ